VPSAGARTVPHRIVSRKNRGRERTIIPFICRVGGVRATETKPKIPLLKKWVYDCWKKLREDKEISGGGEANMVSCLLNLQEGSWQPKEKQSENFWVFIRRESWRGGKDQLQQKKLNSER